MNRKKIFITLLSICISACIQAQNMIEYQSTTGVIESPAGVIKRNLAPGGGNAGGYSFNKIYEGENGWIEYVATQVNKGRAFGFSVSTNFAVSDIAYGFYLKSDGTLKKVVSGTETALGNYSNNDRLRVERIADTVYYSQNGSVVSKTKIATTPTPFSWVTAAIVDTGGMFEYIQCSFVAASYDTINLNKDARLNSQNSSTNYGTDQNNYASRYGSRTFYTDRSILEFSLTKIPDRTIIGSANLYTYFLSSLSSNACYLERVTGSWTESTVTWANQPSTTTTGRISMPSLSGSASWKTVELKNFIQGWKDGDYSNYGLILKLQNETVTTATQQTHASSDYSTTTYRPYLAVYYRLPRQYAVMQKTLDGGYYSTTNKRICFKYTEEYKTKTNKKLQYNIYDSTNTVKASVSASGTPSPTTSPVLGLSYGENFCELNLANLSFIDKAYYILEIINSKGEKRYLRFRYYNN